MDSYPLLDYAVRVRVSICSVEELQRLYFPICQESNFIAVLNISLFKHNMEEDYILNVQNKNKRSMRRIPDIYRLTSVNNSGPLYWLK